MLMIHELQMHALGSILMIETGGNVDDFIFFYCLSPFCFLLIEFHCTFSFLIKYYNIIFNIIVFCLGNDRPLGLFLCACFAAFHTQIFLKLT